MYYIFLFLFLFFIAPANAQTVSSSGAPSLSGLNLLGTLAAKVARHGFVVQAQDIAANCSTGGGTNGLIVAFDDGQTSTPLIIQLGYATTKGGQGGSIDMSGMNHLGRIRYYGTAGCQVAAAQW